MTSERNGVPISAPCAMETLRPVVEDRGKWPSYTVTGWSGSSTYSLRPPLRSGSLHAQPCVFPPGSNRSTWSSGTNVSVDGTYLLPQCVGRDLFNGGEPRLPSNSGPRPYIPAMVGPNGKLVMPPLPARPNGIGSTCISEGRSDLDLAMPPGNHPTKRCGSSGTGAFSVNQQRQSIPGASAGFLDPARLRRALHTQLIPHQSPMCHCSASQNVPHGVVPTNGLPNVGIVQAKNGSLICPQTPQPTCCGSQSPPGFNGTHGLWHHNSDGTDGGWGTGPGATLNRGMWYEHAINGRILSGSGNSGGMVSVNQGFAPVIVPEQSLWRGGGGTPVSATEGLECSERGHQDSGREPSEVGREKTAREPRAEVSPNGNNIRVKRSRTVKSYSRRLEGNLVLEGDPEEIVVEVDPPMMDPEDFPHEGEGRGDPGTDAGDGGVASEPLTPTGDVFMMYLMKGRRKMGRRKIGCSWSAQWGWKTKGQALSKENRKGREVTGQLGGDAVSEEKNPAPVAVPQHKLKECYVKLERCDAPGSPLYRRLKGGEGRENNSTSAEKEAVPCQGIEARVEPNGEKETESSARQPSPGTKVSDPPEEKDYWLRLLDRERRDTLEALTAVKRRMGEGSSRCSEVGDPDRSRSLSYEEERWILLEEEFRMREVRRKTLASSDDPKVEIPPSATQCAITFPSAANRGSQEEENTSGSPEVTENRTAVACSDGDWSVATSFESEDPSGNLKVRLRRRNAKREEGDRENDFELGKEPVRKRDVEPEQVGDIRISIIRLSSLHEALTRARLASLAGVPHSTECRVSLERLDRMETTNPSRRCSTEMSVEMRSVMLRRGPVVLGNGAPVSSESVVCFRGCLGLSRGSLEESAGSRNVNSRRNGVRKEGTPLTSDLCGDVVMIEMKKLMVVLEKLDFESSRQLLCSRGRTIRQLAPPVDTQVCKAAVRVGRGRSADPVSMNQHPPLKRCYVRLERCDGNERVTGLGIPAKQRR